jgi:hypothetical protein
MRHVVLAVACFALTAAAAAQAPASRPSPPARGATTTTATTTAAKPDADLAQLMRGIFFPNSNLLFDVQQNDPGAPKKAAGASNGNATQTYANVYTGWQVVEGAAAAIDESVDLILKTGRVCSNGKPVPVTNADYRSSAQALRDAARKALVAAKAKNQEQVSDITNDLADACSMCHEKFRDKGPAGSPARCTP